MLSGLIDKYDPRHRELVDRLGPQARDTHEIIKVKCIPIMDILQDNNITHIDYLSIDTEGGELDIIKSIDFNKIAIDVIDVENNYHDDEFQKFLATKGYKLESHLGVDDIFKKENTGQ